MANVELTILEMEARLKGAEQSINQLKELKSAGAGAEQSFASLALKIAGFTSLANLAVDAGRKTVGAIKDMAVESVKLAAAAERATVTWGVLVGDMDKGKKVFQDIQAFAAKTPLSFEGLNAAATTVKGFGATTESIIPILSKLGDIAKGNNQSLQSLALVYGQTMAQGKAKTQDLYQFINAGVPIFNLLAESMNVSAGAIKDLAAEGAITFEEIDKAITKATSAGGQFEGMMEKTALTAEGKWSTAMDNVRLTLADIGTKVLPAATAALDMFNEALERRLAVKNINAVVGGGGNAQQAIKDIEAILELAETDKFAFFDKYVGLDGIFKTYRIGPFTLPKLDLNATKNEIEEYKQMLRIARAELLSIASEEDMATDRAAGRARPGTPGVTPLQPWQLQIKAATGHDSIEQYIDAEISNANRLKTALVALGDDMTNPYEQVIAKFEQLYIDFTTAGILPKTAGTLLGAIGALRLPGSTSSSTPAQPGAGTNTLGTLRPDGRTSDDIAEDRRSKVAAIDAAEAQAALNQLILEGEIATQKFHDKLADIGNLFSDAGAQAWVSTFESIGASLLEGSFAADTFADSMRNIGEQILNALPMMLFQAGVSALSAGNAPAGLALIAASGLAAIGKGAYNQAQSNLEANALGGVYNSPSLHSYANGVYNTPQFFGFAKGAAFGWEGSQSFAKFAQGGVFGEAGAEAIMPLDRDANGRLGVKATGGGSVVNVIINNMAAGTEATASESIGADGQRQVIVTVKKIVQGMVQTGEMDGLLRRGGVRPQGVRN